MLIDQSILKINVDRDVKVEKHKQQAKQQQQKILTKVQTERIVIVKTEKKRIKMRTWDCQCISTIEVGEG